MDIIEQKIDELVDAVIEQKREQLKKTIRGSLKNGTLSMEQTNRILGEAEIPNGKRRNPAGMVALREAVLAYMRKKPNQYFRRQDLEHALGAPNLYGVLSDLRAEGKVKKTGKTTSTRYRLAVKRKPRRVSKTAKKSVKKKARSKRK